MLSGGEIKQNLHNFVNLEKEHEQRKVIVETLTPTCQSLLKMGDPEFTIGLEIAEVLINSHGSDYDSHNQLFAKYVLPLIPYLLQATVREYGYRAWKCIQKIGMYC